jgi:hypothetical protein
MLLLLSRHDVAMPPRHTPLASKQLRDHAWTTDKVLYDTSTLKPTEAAVELQWFEESTGVWISADRTKKRNILTFPWGVFDQVERLSLKPRWVRDRLAAHRAALALLHQMADQLLDAALDDYVTLVAAHAAASSSPPPPPSPPV